MLLKLEKLLEIGKTTNVFVLNLLKNLLTLTAMGNFTHKKTDFFMNIFEMIFYFLDKVLKLTGYTLLSQTSYAHFSMEEHQNIEAQE